jgi:hypothetical protein
MNLLDAVKDFFISRCPVCKKTVIVGSSHCPHCKVALEWVRK